MMSRKIIHLDMDCFYAAIEMRERPELAGQPVAVGGARDRRGVLTTCNYEARKYGVRSAMPTFQALQKCPHLVVIPPRFDVYHSESIKIREILYKFTSLVEPLSLDEAFLDISDHDGDPSAVASVIRQMIYQRTELTASAGIAPNKMLAKIASEWNKPNGQYEVRPEDVETFVLELPVQKLWGIGQKSAAKLQSLGTQTCGQLQRYSRIQLAELFGRFGLELFDLCRGLDNREVVPDRIRKSLSNERTFSRDLTSPTQCEARIPELYEDLISELQKSGAIDRVRSIFVKIRFSDFTRTTVERSGMVLHLDNFLTLLHEGLQRKSLSVRLLGLGVRFQEDRPANTLQLDLQI